MNTPKQTFDGRLNSQTDCGKIRTNREWLVCPRCKKGKLILLLPTTVAKDLPLYCKRCGEVIVNIPSEPEP